MRIVLPPHRRSLVRMGLRVLIDCEDDMAVVAEAGSRQEALHVLRRERPDVLLLDVRMPGMDGLKTLRQIAADPALSSTRVIIVTTFEVDRCVFEALQAGAAGFVLKDTAPAELVRAIRVVTDGQALLSPSVTCRVVSLFSQPIAESGSISGLDSTTDREREVVASVATGCSNHESNHEIATELFMSPATVRTHVSSAMVKLHARSRAQLAVFGVHTGLIIER